MERRCYSIQDGPRSISLGKLCSLTVITFEDAKCHMTPRIGLSACVHTGNDFRGSIDPIESAL